jgi:Tfp pilus assembly protein PilE
VQAPLSLKTAAARLNIDGLIDPEGTWAALRKSARISREEGLVTVEAQIPEASVKRAVAEGSSVATFAIIGVFAGIAIPQFEKYQCQTKQTEVETALSSAAAAAKQVRESGGKADTLESIGFVPPDKSRYNYCVGTQCVPCQAQGCYQPAPAQNPCLRLAQAHDTTSKYRFLMCAVADLDDSPTDGDVDVWVVTEDGTPKHLQDDCK